MLKSKRFNTAATIILTVLVIITLLPLALIVISSFTKESALIRNGYSFWPQEWSLDAYYYMIKQGAVILRSYGISVFVTVVGTAASVILTTMLAYPMSRKSFKYHNALSFFVFFTMLFNGGIVPSYIMWTKIFRIKDTIFALLIPNYLVTAFNVILVKNYYANNIPDSLIEAAEIDGAGRFRRMISITIPCIKGTVMIMVIFAVAGILNNNFDQIYVLQNSFNLERSEVIDTYIYKIGIQQLQFGMAAAVNITKSFFSLALLLLANGIVSKLSDGYGLF